MTSRETATVLIHLVAVLLLACSGPDGRPSQDDADAGAPGGPDAGQMQLSTISGTVWAPGNGPGMVPAGQEIPVFDALVYLSHDRPDPIDPMAHCMPCSLSPANGVATDADGNFSLPHVVPNEYWLVIEKGQFRLEQRIVVSGGAVVELSAEETTLPSRYDPDNGKWIPKIALASGLFDSMEDILGKLGLGEIDSEGLFVGNTAYGVFDLYANGGANDFYSIGTLEELVLDLDRMMNYHIIFIPCSDSTFAEVLSNPDQKALHNIRDYVAAGGKLYVTDWSGEWSDNVFPSQVEFGAEYDTPAGAYDAATDTWDVTKFGTADGYDSYTSDAQASQDGLRDWLDGQVGPSAGGGMGPFDPMNMEVEGNWNHIEGLHSVELGVDGDNNPILDEPATYVMGTDDDDTPDGLKPLTVTFEPAGCGRVLYSTYHTTDLTHLGLVPQERVLVYLIMEIGICKTGPIVD